jgi:hypothetical protein
MIDARITSAKNLFWTSPEEDRFDAEILFAEESEYLPTACGVVEVGVVPHMTDLWNRAVNGEFGQIAPFVPPPEVDPDAQNTATPSSGVIPGSIL